MAMFGWILLVIGAIEAEIKSGRGDSLNPCGSWFAAS